MMQGMQNQVILQKNIATTAKKELAAAMKVDKSEIPFGVEFFLADFQDGKPPREIFCFKLPGQHIANTKNLHQAMILHLEKSILGIGSFGKIIPLINMDNTKELLVVKIKKHDSTNSEFKHAFQGKLAIAHCIQASPSHNNTVQERIYMVNAKGIKFGDYFIDYDDKINMKACIMAFRHAAAAIFEQSHQFGMVHRDINANNIHIDPNTLLCTLLDFGFQAALNEHSIYTEKQGPCGTIPNIAPELFEARNSIFKCFYYTHQSDLFSFGICLAEILDQIDPKYYIKNYLREELVIKLGGAAITTVESDLLKSRIPDAEVRQLLLTFLGLLTHKDVEARPQSIVDCITFFENLYKLAEAKEANTDGKIHFDLLKKQITSLQQTYQDKLARIEKERETPSYTYEF